MASKTPRKSTRDAGQPAARARKTARSAAKTAKKAKKKAGTKAAVQRRLSPAGPGAGGQGKGRGKTRPTLLAGGNPQIAKADGDAPVQAYIAALPGWKSEVARRLDGLIERSVPGVRKAVRWNSPFYGVEGQGWFLSLHAFARYVKVAFFRGAALRPVPPGESRQEQVRYLDLLEDGPLDEVLLAKWILQAAALPGWEQGAPRAADERSAGARETKRPAARQDGPRTPGSAARSIDQRIRELDDWRGSVLERMRRLIHEADPEVVEEWKWKGTPVWSHDGILCTGESYKQVVKLTFLHGAALPDPARLFNASLEGHARRAIDIRKDHAIAEAPFKALIRAAVAFNLARRKK